MRSVSLLLLIALGFTAPAFGQTKGTVKGTVKSADGQPAAYVNVVVQNTPKGTITNESGEFEIRNIEPGQHVLVVSFVGLQPREQSIEITAGKTTLVGEITLVESAEQLQEIVVSDQRLNAWSVKQSEYVAKLPLTNLENPQVYSAINKDLLTQQMVFSVDDAVKNAPGLQKMWEATGRSGDGGAYFNARGFILQSQLRNGVAGNISSRIDAVNLERIEVIKGPSATLFGSTLTSYGGLINRVTKKPYSYFGGEVAYSSGSYGLNRVSADINVPLNEEKTALARINAAYHYEGSFQDNGFDRNYIVAPSFTYTVNDRLSFNVDAEFYRGENSSKQIIFFYFPADQLGASSADELGIEYKKSYSSNDIFQTSKNSSFFVQMNYKLSSQWTSQSNFTSTTSYSDGPYGYYYLIPNAVQTGDPNATGADYLARADQSTENGQITVKEFQQNFIGDFLLGGLRNRMVVGVDFFTQNSNQVFYGADFDVIYKNASLSGDGTIPNYEDFNRTNLNAVLEQGTWRWPYKYKTNSYSAYTSDVVNVFDNLSAMVSLRYDYYDNEGSEADGSGDFTLPYSQSTLSPKFGLVYQPVKGAVALFANYQNGFVNKNGRDVVTNKSFEAEHANQVEGGVKLDLLGGRVSSTLSYYDIQVSNVVRAHPTAENPNGQRQDGTQSSKGIEAEIVTNPIDGLQLFASFSYNDSEYTKADDDVAGRRPSTAMSPYAANLWLSYTMRQGTLRGLGVGFGGNYASDNKILNSQSMGVFTLPAYTILNASVFYDRPKFRAGLKLDNLTNEKYWIGYGTMNPQKLRSFTGSLAIKF